MDKVEYTNKFADLIGNSGYSKEKPDPEDRTEAVTDHEWEQRSYTTNEM